MKVKIKDWTELEKIALYEDEYEDLVLPNTICFTSEMEFKLPIDRIIEISDDYIWSPNSEGYLITEDMIEKKFLEDLPEELYIPNEKEELDIIQEYFDKFPPIDEKEDIFAINLEALNSIDKTNRQIHYLKWKITDNLSIRYFYNWETRKEMNGQFALKNHKEKETFLISEKTAREMINSFCVEKFEEVIGYNVKKVGYRKYIKSFGGEFKEFVNI